MHPTYTKPMQGATWLDRATAHLLTVALIGVTSWLLLEDVIWHGAPFTGEHAITCVAIAVSALFPRLVGNLARAGHYLFTGIACIVMAAALTYIVLSSIDRTAEAIAQKGFKAHSVDTARTNLLRQKEGFEILLGPCRPGTPKTDAGVKCGMREAVTIECASGKGARCDGRKEGVAQYEAQLLQIAADLKAINTEKVRRPYHALAELLVDVFGGKVADVEVRLGRIMPAIAVVLTELGISVAHVASGIGRPVKVPRAETPAPTPPGKRSRRGATSNDLNIISFVERHRAVHGCDPSIRAVQVAFPGIPTSTAARYRKLHADATVLPLRRVGAG